MKGAVQVDIFVDTVLLIIVPPVAHPAVQMTP